MHDYTVSSLLYKSDVVIVATRGTMESMIPTCEVLSHAVLIQLIGPLHLGTKVHAESQTAPLPPPVVTMPSAHSDPVYDRRPDHVWDPNARPASVDTIP